jgi:hypothetical protein
MGKHPVGDEERAGWDAVRERERGFYEKVEREQDLDAEEAEREVGRLSEPVAPRRGDADRPKE